MQNERGTIPPVMRRTLAVAFVVSLLAPWSTLPFPGESPCPMVCCEGRSGAVCHVGEQSASDDQDACAGEKAATLKSCDGEPEAFPLAALRAVLAPSSLSFGSNGNSPLPTAERTEISSARRDIPHPPPRA